MTFPVLPVLPSSPPCPVLHHTSQRSAWRQLLWEASPHCFYCGKQIRRRGGTLDHVLPQSRGGQHLPENLVLCCRHCNLAKNDRTLHEWLEQLVRAAHFHLQLKGSSCLPVPTCERP